MPELGLVLEQEQVLVQELALVLVLEPGQGLVPGQVRVLEPGLGLGLHRQPSLRLRAMPAELTIVSFSLVTSF